MQWKEALQRWLDVAAAAIRIIFSGRDADDLEVRFEGLCCHSEQAKPNWIDRRELCGAVLAILPVALGLCALQRQPVSKVPGA